MISDQPVAEGIGDQLRHVLGIGLAQHILAVIGNGILCNIHMGSYLLAAPALRHVRKDALFLRGKQAVFLMWVKMIFGYQCLHRFALYIILPFYGMMNERVPFKQRNVRSCAQAEKGEAGFGGGDVTATLQQLYIPPGFVADAEVIGKDKFLVQVLRLGGQEINIGREDGFIVHLEVVPLVNAAQHGNAALHELTGIVCGNDLGAAGHYQVL